MWSGASALASVEVSSSGRKATDPREGRVEANGIDFAFLEAGAGPLALCLHGFPDSAHTWRHLLPELAGAGFRAVAPFMRGYAPSALASDGRYELGALVADTVALHESLGGDERAVLIGSDWGGEAAYGAAAMAPGRWRRLVTIGVPPAALDERIFSDYEQIRRSFYLFFMKTPRAEAVIAADEMGFLDRLWGDWSPGHDAGEDLARVKACLREPENLAAAVAYYRSDEPGLYGGGRESPYRAEEEALLSVAPQPTLYLHGERDGCIGVELVRDAEGHLARGSRMEVIAGSGHFPQVERPAAVNELILDWIA